MSTIENNRSWTHFRVDRRNPRYCHVTFDLPGHSVSWKDGPNDRGEYIAKAAFLIRARSVVQVHPGPPLVFSHTVFMQ